AQREWLLRDGGEKLMGFLPRAAQRKAVEKPPWTTLKLKVRHQLRSSPKSFCLHPKMDFQKWLETGQLPPCFAERAEKPHDSNIWRAIASSNDYPSSHCHGPIPIPPPSWMCDNTYVKFISQGDLKVSDEQREKIIRRVIKELEENKKLKLRSKNRVPPINKRGNIQPPENYKR
uniref:Uncharacterized protein n=1 Tax=Latimeria chalumnae TaxID=7897 RepID=H3AK02_LATCH